MQAYIEVRTPVTRHPKLLYSQYISSSVAIELTEDAAPYPPEDHDREEGEWRRRIVMNKLTEWEWVKFIHCIGRSAMHAENENCEYCKAEIRTRTTVARDLRREEWSRYAAACYDGSIVMAAGAADHLLKLADERFGK